MLVPLCPPLQPRLCAMALITGGSQSQRPQHGWQHVGGSGLTETQQRRANATPRQRNATCASLLQQHQPLGQEVGEAEERLAELEQGEPRPTLVSHPGTVLYRAAGGGFSPSLELAVMVSVGWSSGKIPIVVQS